MHIYHIDEATIDLGYPILESSNNTKFFLGIEDKVWADFDFYEMPDLVEVEKAAKSCTYNST